MSVFGCCLFWRHSAVSTAVENSVCVEEQQQLAEREPLLCRCGSASEGECEAGAGGVHGWSAGVDRFDDFAGVDALEIDRGHAEVAMAELALNDI